MDSLVIIKAVNLLSEKVRTEPYLLAKSLEGSTLTLESLGLHDNEIAHECIIAFSFSTSDYFVD